MEKRKIVFLGPGPKEKKKKRCNGARGGAWQQPAPTSIPEMFQNSGTRRQSRRHCNTRRRCRPYKRRALRAAADRERERPRAAPAPSAPPREGPRQKDVRNPLAASALASVPPGPSHPPPRPSRAVSVRCAPVCWRLCFRTRPDSCAPQ